MNSRIISSQDISGGGIRLRPRRGLGQSPHRGQVTEPPGFFVAYFMLLDNLVKFRQKFGSGYMPAC